MFSISISASSLMSAAVISPFLFVSIVRNLGSSQCITGIICLRFSTMSVTSSLTPLIVLNSCCTLSILTAVTAAPWIEDRSVLRRAFPIVLPNPRSSGSTLNLAKLGPETDSSITISLGIKRLRHFI